MAKERKTLKLNAEVLEVLRLVSQDTNATETRVIESALTAYGARILGDSHPAVESARWCVARDVNNFRKT